MTDGIIKKHTRVSREFIYIYTILVLFLQRHDLLLAICLHLTLVDKHIRYL